MLPPCLADRLIKPAAHLGRIDVTDPHPLLAGSLPGHELETRLSHPEDLRAELEDGRVRPPVRRWGSDADPQRVPVATHDAGPSGAGLDAETEHHVARSPPAVALTFLAHHLEQVLGHVAIL